MAGHVGAIIYFADAGEFRSWLEAHHARVSARVLGFYKRGSGRSGVGYADAVDDALIGCSAAGERIPSLRRAT